jgi:hypothetical protein
VLVLAGQLAVVAAAAAGDVYDECLHLLTSSSMSHPERETPVAGS